MPASFSLFDHVRAGDALDTLPILAKEGLTPFDFIFIDADRANNPTYLEWAITLVRPDTVIIGDNVVRNGAVTDASSTDPNVVWIRQFCHLLVEHPRLSTTAIQTVGSKGFDGVAIALVTAGLSGFWPSRPPTRHDEWRLGPMLTPMLAIFSIALGGSTPFFAFALAAGGMAWFAFAGATLGAFAVSLIAAMLGEAGWQALPLRTLRAIAAALFLIAGIVVALRVFGLVG